MPVIGFLRRERPRRRTTGKTEKFPPLHACPLSPEATSYRLKAGPWKGALVSSAPIVACRISEPLILLFSKVMVFEKAKSSDRYVASDGGTIEVVEVLQLPSGIKPRVKKLYALALLNALRSAFS